jgi:hypothetical protein
MLPDWLDALFRSGHVADLAVAILIAETAVVMLLFKGARHSGLVANALSGVCLLLALRAALTGGPLVMVAVWLTGGFAAHLADTISRLRR